MSIYLYETRGICPNCERSSYFRSTETWYRDFLACSNCGSVPRERALATVLEQVRPNWRNMRIHESSPSARGVSEKIRKGCDQYIASQFFPDKQLGCMIDKFRNENLEKQTFDADTFDIVITLDVMEHVNFPERVFQEIARTLVPGGVYIFTVPTYKDRVSTVRKALYRSDGGIDYMDTPEYHGNPISDAGSLVTFHYGYDLPELIYKWSGMDVEVRRFHDHKHGLIGDFTECYIARTQTGGSL